MILFYRYMNKYLLWLVWTLVGSHLYGQKISPNTEAFLLQHESVSSRSADGVFVKAYLETDGTALDSVLTKMGCRIFVREGSFLTAEIPVEYLRDVASLSSVKYIQMASPVRPTMNQSRKLGNADWAHSASNPLGTAFLGRDVVVGIIDNGFDYGHAAYYSPDGNNYRIKRIWDQNKTSGRHPLNFNYGTEYTTETEMLAAGYDIKNTYHGGHVAGIAAGGDMTLGYHGVAPEADLVLVSNGATNVDVTNAVKYIFEYAESVNKPCVINMSIGMHYGPHDGTSTSDRMFDELAGPGRLLVGACGNEGNLSLHLSKKFTSEESVLKTMIGYASENNKQALIDIWGNPGKNFTVQGVVVDLTKGKIVAETEVVSSTEMGSRFFQFETSQVGADATFTIVSQSVASHNLRPNIYVESTANHLAANRKLGLVVTGEDGTEVHLWNCSYGPFISGNKKGWAAGDTDFTVSEVGGTAQEVIAVGSFNSQFRFANFKGSTFSVEDAHPLNDISSFSSHGPTLDGRIKPDVVAPGWCVVSAALESAISPDDAMGIVWKNGRKSYYEINGGTSMAAPYVTGTLALWLEANPDLTPQRVREIIQSTAQDDEYAHSLPNMTWGYGKIDTYAGLAHVMGVDAGLRTNGEESMRIGCRVTDHRKIELEFPQNVGNATLRILSLTGQTLFSEELSHTYVGKRCSISTDGWSSGVYMVMISSELFHQCMKIMLR